MDEVARLIGSPAFWFASVALAFLMSFFAAYAKDWTDSWLVSRSIVRDGRAKARQRDFEEKVARLKTDQTFLALYQSNIVYQKVRQTLYLTVGYVSSLLALFSILHHDFVTAISMFLFSVFLGVTQIRWISRRLADLRAVVNAALGEGENHFLG